MLVDKISLKNFRKYEEFEVEFNNRLTVVVGKNGTGKTGLKKFRFEVEIYYNTKLNKS